MQGDGTVIDVSNPGGQVQGNHRDSDCRGTSRDPLGKLPLVSAIIPTYNRARTLGRAIDSILDQTYPRIELIVVDDGSTDESFDVIRSYGDRIRSVRRANGGASSARNAGIDQASGEIITFLDSDDSWLPTKVERQVDLLGKAGSAVPCCICDTTMIYASGLEKRAFSESMLVPPLKEGIWINVLPILATRFILFNQAAAIRRDVLIQCGGFDDDLWVMEDYDLALKIAAQGPWAVIAEPLVVWHGGAENSLSEAAYREPARLHDALDRILTRALDVNSTMGAATHFFLWTRRFLARSELLSKRVGASCGRFGSILGAALSVAGAAGARSLRRLPWYPEMEFEAIEDFQRNLNHP